MAEEHVCAASSAVHAQRGGNRFIVTCGFAAALVISTVAPCRAQDRPVHLAVALRTSAAPVRTGVRAHSAAEALTHTQLLPLFREASAVYGVPIELLRAVARAESGFNPRAVSRVGAAGIMQLMPATAGLMGVTNRFDPRQSILGGARYLRLLAEAWHGDLIRTIASYNAGPGAVSRYNGIPPFRETRRYVRRVLAYYRAYRTEMGPP